MRFDAVAFDLDGTLYPAPRLYARALPTMIGKLRGVVAFNRTRQRMRAMGLTADHSAAAPADGAAFQALEARLFAGLLGSGLPEATAIMHRDFYRGVEELFLRIKPFTGLTAALDALSAAGLRLGLLSDLPPLRKLELMGLSGRFEVALCSEDSGFLKPAREPFAMLASRMQLPPGRILYVGNNPRIDVAGAKAAGMSTAIVSRRRVHAADLSFFDWRELVTFAQRT